MTRRRFIYCAATGLMVPLTAKPGIPFPLGFWKPASSSGCSAAAVAARDDWVTRVQGRGSDVTGAGVQDAVCAYIDGLMTDGVWTKLKRHSIYAGDSLAALEAPLINTAGGATDTLTNFDSADYAQNAGLTGNGTDEYVDTALARDAAALGASADDIHFSAYVRTGSDQAGCIMGASHSAGVNTTALYASFIGISYWQCNNNTTQMAQVADSAGTGHYVGSRISSTSSVLYKNAVSIASNAVAGFNLGPEIIMVHANNVQGGSGPFQFTTRTLEMYSVGPGLTSTDVTNFGIRYATLRTALGR